MRAERRPVVSGAAGRVLLLLLFDSVVLSADAEFFSLFDNCS